MKDRRLIFKNWIGDVASTEEKPLEMPDKADEAADIRQAVGDALNMLSEPDRELIVRFYFMGEGFQQLSDLTERQVHKLVLAHDRALRKLRGYLATFVHDRFRIKPDPANVCPICESPHVARINALITGRNKKETWRPVMDRLKRDFGLHLKSHHVVIGHERYHIPERNS